jgi:hypothetical protein
MRLEDDKKRPVEKYLEGGRGIMHGTIPLVVGGVRDARLETAQPASNRDSNREFLNTIIAPTTQNVKNIILQQIDTKIKAKFSFLLKLFF